MTKLLKRSFELALALGLAASAGACNNTDFKGNSAKQAADKAPVPTPPAPTPAPPAPTPTPVQPVQQKLTLTCDQLTAATTTSVDVVAPAGKSVQVQVSGQICPKIAENLTVLFIVDWSGSMKDSDPTTATGCGRAQAAQAILSYLQSNSPSNVAITAGLIPFNNTVQTSGVIALTPLAQFQPLVGATTFCNAKDGTSYVAAFQAAQQMLAGVAGRKVIYFLSDGAPNYDAGGHYAGSDNPPPGSAAVTDSIAAGQALVASAPDITLNALLLGQSGQQGQDIMTSVAGSADHVRLAANASDLATQIVQFPGLTLDQSSVKAILSSPSVTGTAVQLASFAPDAQPGVWDFLTQPLTLEGKSGQTVANTVKLTVSASDGSQQQAAVVVNYKVP